MKTTYNSGRNFPESGKKGHSVPMDRGGLIRDWINGGESRQFSSHGGFSSMKIEAGQKQTQNYGNGKEQR